MLTISKRTSPFFHLKNALRSVSPFLNYTNYTNWWNLLKLTHSFKQRQKKTLPPSFCSKSLNQQLFNLIIPFDDASNKKENSILYLFRLCMEINVTTLLSLTDFPFQRTL